jgi:hypothetical protein
MTTAHDRQTLISSFLRNIPLVIVAFALLYLLTIHLNQYFRPIGDTSVRSELLVSPTADSDLAKLEADVILGALASSILPREDHFEKGESGPDRGIRGEEAEDVIEDFKRYDNVSSERWEKVGWLVGIVGGVVFLGISIARAIVERDWRVVPFPVSRLSFTRLPASPLEQH